MMGRYSYGNPNILFETSENKCTIGSFCSIAGGVMIFAGGNHRTDCVTT